MDSEPFVCFPAGGALHHLITADTGLAQDLAPTAQVSADLNAFSNLNFPPMPKYMSDRQLFVENINLEIVK